MTSAKLNTGTTMRLGKHTAITECLLTNAVKPHASTDTVSNQVKVTSVKHPGFARDVQTTTYHLSSTKRDA